MQTNKDVAEKIFKSIVQCVKLPYFFISNGNAADLSTSKTDGIVAILNSLIEKIKCGLDVIGNMIDDERLENVYLKFRADIEDILNNDVKQCMQTKGSTDKLK